MNAPPYSAESSLADNIKAVNLAHTYPNSDRRERITSPMIRSYWRADLAKLKKTHKLMPTSTARTEVERNQRTSKNGEGIAYLPAAPRGEALDPRWDLEAVLSLSLCELLEFCFGVCACGGGCRSSYSIKQSRAGQGRSRRREGEGRRN